MSSPMDIVIGILLIIVFVGQLVADLKEGKGNRWWPWP